MAEDSKITFCPNCQQPAVRSGNEITCETCDTTYTITVKEGAKVKQIGRIESLEQRVDLLEGKGEDQGGDQDQGGNQDQGDGEDQGGDEDQGGEGEILPR